MRSHALAKLQGESWTEMIDEKVAGLGSSEISPWCVAGSVWDSVKVMQWLLLGWEKEGPEEEGNLP